MQSTAPAQQLTRPLPRPSSILRRVAARMDRHHARSIIRRRHRPRRTLSHAMKPAPAICTFTQEEVEHALARDWA